MYYHELLTALRGWFKSVSVQRRMSNASDYEIYLDAFCLTDKPPNVCQAFPFSAQRQAIRTQSNQTQE